MSCKHCKMEDCICTVSYQEFLNLKETCKQLIKCIDAIENSICCSIPYEQIQVIVKAEKFIEEIEKSEMNKEETEFDKKMKECHQYGLCIQYDEKPDGMFCVCKTCPLKKDKE